MWLRWASARALSVRARIRAACGTYNQWPIILTGATHQLPVDRLPARPVCLANDNWGGGR